MMSLIVSSRREHEGTDTYVFGYRAVQDMAPKASGVYTIYTSQQWLYVGESDDIRQSLFEHLNAPGACMKRRGPLSYSFELVPAAERAIRRQALVTALVPACNPAMR
jgi:predicted GIY-YIG superfamily endonuclease